MPDIKKICKTWSGPQWVAQVPVKHEHPMDSELHKDNFAIVKEETPAKTTGLNKDLSKNTKVQKAQNFKGLDYTDFSTDSLNIVGNKKEK